MTDFFDDQEAAELLASADFARHFADVVHREVMEPAKLLFGDRATPWIASTLRMTADVLERLDLR